MTSGPTHRIYLDANRFTVSTTFVDPDTGNELRIPCEVDTGNPTEVALPKSESSRFTEFEFMDNYGGAGIGPCEVYSATLRKIGSLSVEYECRVTMALEESYPYGLIGVDLLKYMTANLDGDPSSKYLDLYPTHM